MHFSSRVDISEPNPIAVEEAAAKRQGVTLGKLNDSNPTRHGLAPASVPEVYSAEPKGQRYVREALATFLNGRGNGRCEADDLYILSSTSEAYSWLIKLPVMPCSRRSRAIRSSNPSHVSNASIRLNTSNDSTAPGTLMSPSSARHWKVNMVDVSVR